MYIAKKITNSKTHFLSFYFLFLLSLKYSEAMRREDNLVLGIVALQLYVLRTLLPEVRTPNIALI